jgi:uncharacterized protein (UPF0212 family)
MLHDVLSLNKLSYLYVNVGIYKCPENTPIIIDVSLRELQVTD